MASDPSLCRYNCGNTYPDRLTKNSENQPVEKATIRVYTFTAGTMWFRNYYVAYAFAYAYYFHFKISYCIMDFYIF